MILLYLSHSILVFPLKEYQPHQFQRERQRRQPMFLLLGTANGWDLYSLLWHCLLSTDSRFYLLKILVCAVNKLGRWNSSWNKNCSVLYKHQVSVCYISLLTIKLIWCSKVAQDKAVTWADLQVNQGYFYFQIWRGSAGGLLLLADITVSFFLCICIFN